MTQETAVIVGVGLGLGAALARRFARDGMNVAMAARSPDKLAGLAAELVGTARAYACDAADEHAVTKLFADVARDFSAPRLVVFNAGAFVRKGILETTVEEFIGFELQGGRLLRMPVANALVGESFAR